ncbi:MAG: ABC transporter permease [Bacillales bacterium]|nr:ABC transporter permease [Bacillales bacterium]
MRNFWIVTKHTFLTKLKTKSFLISTGIMIVIVLILANLNTVIDMFNQEKQRTVAVIDTTGEYIDLFENQLMQTDNSFMIVKDANELEAIEKVKSGEWEGVLTITIQGSGIPEAVYRSMKISDESTIRLLQSTLTEVKNQKFTEAIQLDAMQIAELYTPAAFKVVSLEENAKSASELNAARGLVYVMLFVIYFIVIGYAGMIASEVASEKTSRVMEILVSSISPVKQMFAKILGIACLSFVQMGAFLLVGYFSIRNLIGKQDEIDFLQFFGFDGMKLSTIVYAVIFALLGYLFYAVMAAFLGSLVSRVEDIQPMITPMTMLVVVAFVISMFGLGNPDTILIQICSFIPPFTPLIMFLRVGMLDVPFWEVGLSLILLLASIILLAVLGAKIYRGGVLMYGKGTSLKDLKHALTLGKKES